MQPDPDDGLDPGALLRVDVDVREVRRVDELDEADVVLGELARDRQVRVREERAEVDGVYVLPVEWSCTTVSRLSKTRGSPMLM